MRVRNSGLKFLVVGKLTSNFRLHDGREMQVWKKTGPQIPESSPIPNIVLADNLGHPITDCLIVRGFSLEETLMPTS